MYYVDDILGSTGQHPVVSPEKGLALMKELFRAQFPEGPTEPTTCYVTGYYCLYDESGECKCNLLPE